MSADVAAWVQAIGSIAAVGAGFAYHAWQINLGLRQRLQVAIDAIALARVEISDAQNGSRSNFPDFDTTKLRLIVDCLESNCTIITATLKDQMSIRLVLGMLRQYIGQWDSDTGRFSVRDAVERSVDVMDLDGSFDESMATASEALSRSLEGLQRNPFRTH